MSEDRPVWLRRENAFKRALGRRHPLAMWVTIPWPPLVQIVGSCGVDAVLIDMEHTSLDLNTSQNLMIAAEAAGVTPIVRPSEIDPVEVSLALDAGALGIIFPMVSTIEDAALAHQSIRYPPHGTRPWGGAHTRHAMWQGTSAIEATREARRAGSHFRQDPESIYSSAYVEKAAEDIVSIFIIETDAGVAQIDGILETGKPDLVVFGWGDYLIESDFDYQATEDAAQMVHEICRNSGIGVSISPGQPNSMEPYPGCFSIIGLDALILREACDALVKRVQRRSVGD